MGDFNDIDKRDEERNKVLDVMFKKQYVPSGIDLKTVKADLEKDIFDLLKKYGFERDKAMPAVANLIYNLSRL